jgi:hypothetical protein
MISHFEAASLLLLRPHDDLLQTSQNIISPHNLNELTPNICLLPRHFHPVDLITMLFLALYGQIGLSAP